MVLTRAFPKQSLQYFVPFLEIVWTDLVFLSDKYETEVVHGHELENTSLDSDGESMGVQSLLFSSFEFLAIATRKKHLRSLMTRGQGAAGDFLKSLSTLLLKYLQITGEMVRHSVLITIGRQLDKRFESIYSR